MPSDSPLIVVVAVLAVASVFPAMGTSLQTSPQDRPSCSLGGGADPYAGVIFDATGNLYGTTLLGGAHFDGTVFKLTPGTNGQWTKTSPHTFNCDGGAYPYGGVISDAAGNLYGTTAGGGRHNFGNVFKLTLGTNGQWTKTVLYNFTAKNGDGANPYSKLIFDAAGNLYGTTYGGGTYLGGTVFKLAPGADGQWVETTLYELSDGTDPVDGLIFDSAGNLYGAGSYGGLDYGSIFELSPQADGTWTETVLHTFDRSDGMWPYASLIVDRAGNLYGTTYYGGDQSCGCGVVFELTPEANGSWTYAVLHEFTGKNGANPYASLIFDASGNLYGTTEKGGSYHCDPTYGCGTVFKLAPGTDGKWIETVLHEFDFNDGGFPDASLIFDAAGDLYGTTTGGGHGRGEGTVFKLVPGTNGRWTETVLHTFYR